MECFERNKYSVLEKIADGGFSDVYIAQTTLSVVGGVILKIMKKNNDIIFHRECHILQSLSHPFICKYIEHTYIHSRNTLVLEYIDGIELYHLMFKAKLSYKSILFILSCILSALAYLHTSLILYRDLKPENVMINTQGYAIMVDFGFAKRMQSAHTHTYCGTCGYMAPEIKKRKPYSYPVDMYSFGVFMYELYTGELPDSTYKYIPYHFMSCVSNLLSTNGVERKTAIALQWSYIFKGVDFERIESKGYVSPIQKPQVNFPITPQ